MIIVTVTGGSKNQKILHTSFKYGPFAKTKHRLFGIAAVQERGSAPWSFSFGRTPPLSDLFSELVFLRGCFAAAAFISKLTVAVPLADAASSFSFSSSSSLSVVVAALSLVWTCLTVVIVVDEIS